MNYHLYFHDDFDGIASGAVMLDFLKKRGDNIVSYHPINYSPSLKKNWAKFKFEQPSILIDFLYNPNAIWWFDHHETTFISPKWRKNYANDKNHAFDANFKSGCGLVLTHLEKEYGYKAPKYIRDTVKWGDIIDGALYKSAKQAVEKKEPALKLLFFLNAIERQDPKKYNTDLKYLIHQLAAQPISRIIKLPRLAKIIKKQSEKEKKSIKKFKKFSVPKDKTIFVDTFTHDLPRSHYLVYYLFPKSMYSVLLSYYGGFYHISVGQNRWLKVDRNVDIGELLAKYGGGGHKTIGALERKSKKDILKIVDEIIEYLNKHG